MPTDRLRQGLIRSCLAVVVLALGSACGTGSDVERWRFAIEEIEGSVQHAYAERFRELVEERSGGEVEVVVYPYGALGTSVQLTEQIQSGALQLAFASPGHLGSVVPEVQVFSLHFVLSEDEDVNHRVLTENEPLYELLGDAYRERRLVLLSIVPEGWMAWTANRALRTPEDFAGLKIRTMVSPLLVDVYQAYGASPTPMPYGEVYSGLQLKMIDGQVNPVFAIEEMSFHEVQDYLILPHHAPFVSTLVAAPAFYDALSAERRALLEGVLRDADDDVARFQADLNAERLERIREEGGTEILELSPAERAAFRARSLPVRETFVEMTGERGRAVLDALLAGVAAAEADGEAPAAAAAPGGGAAPASGDVRATESEGDARAG